MQGSFLCGTCHFVKGGACTHVDPGRIRTLCWNFHLRGEWLVAESLKGIACFARPSQIAAPAFYASIAIDPVRGDACRR